MVQVPCYDATGNALDPIEVDESLFGSMIRFKTLHQVVIQYGANKRVGTASTKTRGEIKGSGRKLFRQKGTGRARAGTVKSPLRRGGGVTFGPKPRDYRQDIPRRMRMVALDSALLAKLKDGEVVVIDGLTLEAPKTKTIATILNRAGIYRVPRGDEPGKGRKTFSSLLVTDDRTDDNADALRTFYRSARNIERVKVTEVRGLNAYDVVRRQRLVLTKSALEALIARQTARPKSRSERAFAASSTSSS